MAFPKPEDEKNSRRMAIQFKPRDYERLARFSRVTGRLPAVVARTVILDFLDAHEDEVAELEKAVAAYQSAFKNLKDRNAISLFPEYPDYENEEAK